MIEIDEQYWWEIQNISANQVAEILRQIGESISEFSEDESQKYFNLPLYKKILLGPRNGGLSGSEGPLAFMLLFGLYRHLNTDGYVMSITDAQGQLLDGNFREHMECFLLNNPGYKTENIHQLSIAMGCIEKPLKDLVKSDIQAAFF